VAAEEKSVDDIRQGYDQKIKEVEAKRDELEDRIDDYIYHHDREVDDF
jgi:hypothetical protein